MSRTSQGAPPHRSVLPTPPPARFESDLVALLGAGGVLALFESLRVFGWGRALFLSSAELASYALAAWTAMPALVLLLGLPLRLSTRPDRLGFRVRIGLAAAALFAGGGAGWALTAGRRVRDLSARPLLAAGVAVLLALALILGMRTATLVRTKGARTPALVWGLVCFALAAAALVVDATVLSRSYPAFHGLLFLGAFLAAALAAVGCPSELLPRIAPERARLVAVICLVAAPLALFSLARQSNTSFAVLETAPFTAKLLAPVARKRVPRTTTTAAVTAPAPSQVSRTARGINLQDKDVLLITVDALRADMLSAYGGRGLTPVLDQMARESVVFRRAYTPAPHTSYALASLLTAKFMKPVLELPGAARDHPTLPDLLRRYGYRTAAFYPPAIFFVDGSNFDTLRERGFGFEYRKEMFASAEQRVSQLEAYLREVEPKHPLFVWVHLFEPHEPYEPPPEFAAGDSPKARYEGEVRASDRGIGELTRAFRAVRPNATVIVTADHGEEFGEHGGSYHGTTLYDEQVRVPLLWSSPGAAVAGQSDAPVELVDIGTTLLSAAGVPREARMHGDDLGAVLSGHPEAGPEVAFSSVEQRHMVTDGKLKVVCTNEQAHCQLFDLTADPAELRNLASERAPDVERLRAHIDRFVSTIPRTEALAMANGVGFPEALARARLGVAGVGPELVPLLADSRGPVRAAAARALGDLQYLPALPMLERLRDIDADTSVRAEAAVSALQLGSVEATPSVIALLSAGPTSDAGTEERALVRRAALALARKAHPEALPALSELALDDTAAEGDRLRAVVALGESRAVAVLGVLNPLLADVRLREHVAEAMGKIGGQPARNALAKQLAEERYEPARRAEGRALVALKDRRALPLVLHFLGMESSIPDGVRMLMELGALGPSSPHGVLLAATAKRGGAWECSGERCTPQAETEVSVPTTGRRGASVRVTWLVVASGPSASLVLDGERLPLRAGEQQVSVARSARPVTRFRVSVEGDASLIAVVSAPVQAEIPPPEAEPWDAGIPNDAATASGRAHSP